MAAPVAPSASIPPPSIAEPNAIPSEAIHTQGFAIGSDLPDDRLQLDTNQMDTRSDADTSSLSELVDGPDDQDGSTQLSGPGSYVEENDSEAETERLENTPRKPLSLSVDPAAGLRIGNIDTSPSKLSTHIVAEAQSPPESPITPIDETRVPTLDDKLGENHVSGTQQSLATISEANTLLESLSRKRKRSTPDGDEIGDSPPEGPLRKRSGSSKEMMNGTQSPIPEREDNFEVVEEEAAPEPQPISRLKSQDIEMEEDNVNTPEEVPETVQTKPTKGRKGKRKGKKVVESTEREAGNFDTGDAADMDDVDHHEESIEDAAAHEEELAKKKLWTDDLTRIQLKFNIFREKELNEQLEEVSQQLESLESAEPTHAEFLAMLKCIDERRDEKLTQENKRYDYKVATLKKTVIAERHQIQSQYFQTVRDQRDKSLESCQKRLNQLQKERRRTGTEDMDYSLLYNPKRSEQVRYQTAYNREVSVLSGFAKYRGFPAAPDIASARVAEVEADMKAMEIQTQPPVQSVTNAYPAIIPVPENIRAETQAAEEQFLQRNPWANPQHPAHQAPSSFTPSQPPNNLLVTPAGQKRSTEAPGTNGSASTIDATSNPPSSAVGPGSSATDQLRRRKAGSSSPLLQFKRNTETSRPTPPASHSMSHNASPANTGWRNGQKDSPSTDYPYSSPMAGKSIDNQRPFGLASAAASALSAGHDHVVPPSSRNKTPMGQRSSGVSVGGANGGPFGR